MSLIRQISAGGNKKTTQCQGGGDKKQGLTPNATGFMLGQPFYWRACFGGLTGKGNGRANGTVDYNLRTFYVSTTNQLGGIGRERSQFNPSADGVNLLLLENRIFSCQGLKNKNIALGSFNNRIKIVNNLDSNSGLGDEFSSGFGSRFDPGGDPGGGGQQPKPEPPSNDGTFRESFQKAVGDISDIFSLDPWRDPNRTPDTDGTFLLPFQEQQPSQGIFMRYILDDEEGEYVPASFVSNISPVPSKLYNLDTGGVTGDGPIVTLIYIATLRKSRKLLPGSEPDAPNLIMAYPHDSNSLDSDGRGSFPVTGKFGQGLHPSFLDLNWFSIGDTPGAWGENQTPRYQQQPTQDFVRSVLSINDKTADEIGINFSNIVNKIGTSFETSTSIVPEFTPFASTFGAGALNESSFVPLLFNNSNQFVGGQEPSWNKIFDIYNHFLTETFIGANQFNILEIAFDRAKEQAKKYTDKSITTIYNDILDGLLPGCVALNTPLAQDESLDIRLMLSKLLVFNTLLYVNAPQDPNTDLQNPKNHWGWSEIPVKKDYNNWIRDIDVAPPLVLKPSTMFNLIIYIPIWNPILKSTEDPWPEGGKFGTFWENVYNQLDSYIEKLSADFINFVFATDKQPDKASDLPNWGFKASPYVMTGFTSLGDAGEDKAFSPPDFITTKGNNTFTYYKPNDTNVPGIVSSYFTDSFVWTNTNL